MKTKLATRTAYTIINDQGEIDIFSIRPTPQEAIWAYITDDGQQIEYWENCEKNGCRCVAITITEVK